LKLPKKRFVPWNKGKSQGQKKAFTSKQIRSIYNYLTAGNKLVDKRDLALLCTAVDSMLRASDLVKLKVNEIQNPDGSIKSAIPIQQKKTGEPHLLGLTEITQMHLLEWIEQSCKFNDDYLFTRIKTIKQGGHFEPISEDNYRKIVKNWAKIARVKDVLEYSTHSLRRTKAIELWQRTRNPELIRQVLGQANLSATSHYLGINKKEAIDIARTVDFFKM